MGGTSWIRNAADLLTCCDHPAVLRVLLQLAELSTWGKIFTKTSPSPGPAEQLNRAGSSRHHSVCPWPLLWEVPCQSSLSECPRHRLWLQALQGSCSSPAAWELLRGKPQLDCPPRREPDVEQAQSLAVAQSTSNSPRNSQHHLWLLSSQKC